MTQGWVHPEALGQIKEYQDHLLELGRSRNTIKAYLNDLKNFAEYVSLPLWPEPSDLEGLIQSWLNARQEAGDSIITIRRRIYAVKSFYTYMGVQTKFKYIKIPKNQWYLPTILSLKAADKLFAQLHKNNEEAFVFYRLMFLLGFRFNELYRLKISQEELNVGRIAVEEEQGSARVVVIGKEAKPLLQWYLERGCTWKTKKATLNKTLEVCGKFAGVKKVTNHILRATCAASMLASGHSQTFGRNNMGYRSYTTMTLIMKINVKELIGHPELGEDF